jgi:hypothetical protein
MVVEFLTPAQAELAEAIAYYDDQEEGLGSRFAEEVSHAIQRILQLKESGYRSVHEYR